jgi:hypothetical protein
MEEVLVSTKTKDYLDEDKPIRGQNYCLISFLSPEDILKDKEAYYFSKFIENFGKDIKTLFECLETKYPESSDLIKNIRSNHEYIFNKDEMDSQYKFFKTTNSADIEAEFHRDNNFRTSMRGIKVRGSFDTLDEAKNRSQFIKRHDDKFDIYICQVGCWCPWSPNPNDLADQEYSETQLNTLMKEYKQNMQSKDEMFEQRTADLKAKGPKPENIADDLSQPDPWTASKLANEEVKPAVEEPTVEPTSEPTVVEPTPEPAVEPVVVEPAVVEPTPEPAVVEPTPEPAVVEPTPEPSVEPAVEPTPEPAVVEPTPEPAVVEPTPEPAVVEPTPEPAVVEPTPEPVVVEPTPEPAVVEPTPEPVVEPVVVQENST